MAEPFVCVPVSLLSDARLFHLYGLILSRASTKPHQVELGGWLVQLEAGEAALYWSDIERSMGISRKALRLQIEKLEALGYIEKQLSMLGPNPPLKRGQTYGPTPTVVKCCKMIGLRGSKSGPGAKPRARPPQEKGPIDLDKRYISLDTPNGVSRSPQPQPSALLEMPEPDEALITAGFTRFWNTYGKKIQKPQALEIYRKLILTGKLPDGSKIAGDTRARVEWIQSQVEAFVLYQPDPQYRPYPHRFLRKYLGGEFITAPTQQPKASQPAWDGMTPLQRKLEAMETK